MLVKKTMQTHKHTNISNILYCVSALGSVGHIWSHSELHKHRALKAHASTGLYLISAPKIASGY